MSTKQHPLRVGILLRNRHDGPGGLEKVLEDFEKCLPKKSVEIFWYGLYEPNYKGFTKNFKNICYLQLPKYLLSLKKILPRKFFRIVNKSYVRLCGKKLFVQMEQDHLDVLITMDLSRQFLSNYRLLKQFTEKTKVPVFSWVHSSLASTNTALNRKLVDKIRVFKGHLAISQGIADQLDLFYNAQNVAVIYNPVLPANIITRVDHQFLYVGRIDSNKRVASLLQRLAELHGDWNLDIYGSTGETHADIEFNKYIISLGLGGKVVFHGWRSNPWDEIEKAGVLLLNSESEGFGLVIVEAMMRGIPVISSNCPVGPKELVYPGENGWLYPVDRESDIVVILQEILDGHRVLPKASVVKNSALCRY